MGDVRGPGAPGRARLSRVLENGRGDPRARRNPAAEQQSYDYAAPLTRENTARLLTLLLGQGFYVDTETGELMLRLTPPFAFDEATRAWGVSLGRTLRLARKTRALELTPLPAIEPLSGAPVLATVQDKLNELFAAMKAAGWMEG